MTITPDPNKKHGKKPNTKQNTQDKAKASKQHPVTPAAWLQARRARRTSQRPVLQFSPTAWAKLLYLRDYGPTEVGGFAVTCEDDLLLVQEIALVGQTCSRVSVLFDDDSVADYFDRQVDAGKQPCQFARIWVHTHPGNSAEPSCVDEATFARVFGSSDWAVMFILAQGGETYARLQFNVGPRGALTIPVEVNYQRAFAGSQRDRWEQEYQANVRVAARSLVARRGTWFGSQDQQSGTPLDSPKNNYGEWHDDWQDEWCDEWTNYVDESTSPPA